MAPKVKHFWARAASAQHAVRQDKSVLEQDYYLKLAADEAKAMNLRGMPLSVEHVSGIKIKEGTGTDPVDIKYPKNANVLGRVVDQMVLDDGTILALGEIILGTPGETLAERTLKEAAVRLLEMGHYGVSLTHGFDKHHDGERDENVVRKYPVEMALTLEPERGDSAVLCMYDAEAPYKLGENKYDVYKAGCTSRINYTALDNNDLANQMSTSANSDAAAKAPARAPTAEEFAKLAAEMAALKARHDQTEAELARHRPLAENYLRQKKEEDEARRKGVVTGVTDVHSKTQELMKMLLDLNQGLSEKDRADFQLLVDAGDKQKAALETEMTEILSTDARDKNPNPSPDELWRSMDSVVSKLVPPIAAYSKLLNLTLPLIQEKAAASASKDRAAAKAKPGAPVAAQQAQKKAPEPDFSLNFDKLVASTAAAMKQFDMPDPEVD